MQRETGKQKRQKQKEKSSGGRQNRWAEAGGAGSGKGGERKRQRGSKLSNKQEKAKGKAQESRHQNRFPPLLERAPPFTFKHKESRSLFRKSKFIALICIFFAWRLLASFRHGWRCRLGSGSPIGCFVPIIRVVAEKRLKTIGFIVCFAVNRWKTIGFTMFSLKNV